MKLSISSLQNTLGKELVETGNHLIDNLKTIKILSIVLDLLFTGLGIMGLISLGANVLLIFVLVTILVFSLFFFFRILIKFIGGVIKKLGEFFIEQSETARFSIKLIPKIRKYAEAEYTIMVTNRELFADANEVSCTIGLGLTAQDFEDKNIFDSFESNKETRVFSQFLCGRWISENENIVNISRRKNKSLRFVAADILKNELIVKGNSPDNYRQRDTSFAPRKYIFPIFVNGKVKGGDFSFRMEILCVYKGKDELNCSINGGSSLRLKTRIAKQERT